MPYSDNLYSATIDNSDAESFSDELSPTDGYFRREVPSGAMVPDPSQASRDNKSVEDKVLIPTYRPGASTNSGEASGTTNSPTLAQLHPHTSHNYASSTTNPALNPAPIRSPPPSSSASNTPSSPRSSRRTDPLHPSLTPVMGVPPPAYSPSPISPQAPQERSYNTFGRQQPQQEQQQHQQEHSEQGHRPSRDPESMGRPNETGRPNEDPIESTPLYARVKRNSCRRIIIQKILFVALVFAVMAAFLGTLINVGKSINIKKPSPDKPNTDKPNTDKPNTGGPSPDPSHRPYCNAATIQGDQFRYWFSLDGGPLTIIQGIIDHRDDSPANNRRSVSTAGEIRVRRLPPNDSHQGKSCLTVDVHVSDHELNIRPELDRDAKVLRVISPEAANLASPGPHCISLEITAWIPENTKLTNLLVHARTLGLRVVDDLNIVADIADFETISGDVIFPAKSEYDMIKGRTGNFAFSDSPQALNSLITPEPIEAPRLDIPNTPNKAASKPGFKFDSRRIEIETISGDIKGLYPLLDYLRLASQSGDIQSAIWPQEADPSAPAPAELQAGTTSGDIQLYLPIKSSQSPKYVPPARDYVTGVHSSSGKLSGTFYLGSTALFETSSGDINMKILPIAQSSRDPEDDPKINLKTTTTSGDIKLEILDPIFISPVTYQQPQPPVLSQPISDDDPYLLLPPNKDSFLVDSSRSEARPWHSLLSSHLTTSADITVSYPSAWEGSISGRTISGDLPDPKGKGLNVIKKNTSWGFKEVVARKGVSGGGVGSAASMGSISGDLTFRVRDS